VIRRVHHKELNLLHAEAVEHLWDVYGSRITGEDFGFDLVAILFPRYKFLRSFRNVRVQINPDSVSPEFTSDQVLNVVLEELADQPIPPLADMSTTE